MILEPPEGQHEESQTRDRDAFAREVFRHALAPLSEHSPRRGLTLRQALAFLEQCEHEEGAR